MAATRMPQRRRARRNSGGGGGSRGRGGGGGGGGLRWQAAVLAAEQTAVGAGRLACCGGCGRARVQQRRQTRPCGGRARRRVTSKAQNVSRQKNQLISLRNAPVLSIRTRCHCGIIFQYHPTEWWVHVFGSCWFDGRLADAPRHDSLKKRPRNRCSTWKMMTRRQRSRRCER